MITHIKVQAAVKIIFRAEYRQGEGLVNIIEFYDRAGDLVHSNEGKRPFEILFDNGISAKLTNE